LPLRGLRTAIEYNAAPMQSARLNLIQESPERTIERLQGLGLSLKGARRAMSALVNRGEGDLERVRDVPRERRAAIERALDVPRLEVVERRVDPADGFAKYLLRLPDGRVVEAVRIPLKPGADQLQRFTVCISSEAGCAMGCGFCATARMGLERRLEPWEIVAQILAVRAEAPGRISGAVFMGMGEPFSNFDAVLAAADVLSHPVGLAIGASRITISTVGLVPEMRRFTALGRGERLALSLFSGVEETRRAWIPMAKRHGLAEVRAALAEHCAAGGRPLVAITLIAGVNDSPAEAAAVAAFCRGLPVTIDLIDVNDRAGALRPPAEAARSAYIQGLRAAERPIQVRYSGGQAIEAGCGMLAATRSGGREALPMAGTLAHPRMGAGPV
jgi:23S rRNA (adenine2503-C2)-methyltransferase